MICNELYNGQGLGNQLWNYVVARILADRRHIPFAILGREKFKGKHFMDLDFGIGLTNGSTPEGGPPISLPDGITNYYRERRENLRGTNFDISRTDPSLLQITTNTKFDGTCQSIKYLEGYRDRIRQWLKIKDEFLKYTTDENTCVMHLRCGDFVGIKDVFLPLSYYQQAMVEVKKKNPAVRFMCVTDQPAVAKDILPNVKIVGSSLMAQEDEKKAAHHFGGPIGIDFRLLQQAKYLIIPNSSFSWWASYLNTQAELIVAPKYWAAYNKSNGYWSTSDIITHGFTYLDRKEKLFTAAGCWAEKNAFETTHQNIFQAADQMSPETPSLKKIVSKFGSRVKSAVRHIIS